MQYFIILVTYINGNHTNDAMNIDSGFLSTGLVYYELLVI